MRLLLDTHTFLWWLGGDGRLGDAARKAIADPDNVVYVSAASAWEISIKNAKGRLRVQEDVEVAIDAEGFRPLSIEVAHGVAAGELPPEHRDPFDRVLIAQARRESLVVVTDDRAFDRYDVETLAAGT